MTGTNGGEHMRAIELTSVVSVSIRKRALSKTWAARAPSVATVMNPKSEPSMSDIVLALTCDETATLNIKMKNVPAS